MTSTQRTDQQSPVPDWARERAEMLQGLYIHILVFVVINAGLFFINWFTRGDDGGWWFYWPLMIWAVFGLGIHLLVTVAPVFTSDWVERRARRLADQDRSGSPMVS
jgi:hypothetical protein